MKEEKPSQLLLSNLETTHESILSCLVGQCDIWFHRIVIVVPRMTISGDIPCSNACTTNVLLAACVPITSHRGAVL